MQIVLRCSASRQPGNFLRVSNCNNIPLKLEAKADMPGTENSCPVVPMVVEPTTSTTGTNETKAASCPMHSWPRAIQHIDRKDLYTNLEDRIHYLHTFLDFSSSKRHRINLDCEYAFS